jgi:hypothetical protein
VYVEPPATTVPIDASDGNPPITVVSPEEARILAVEEYVRQGFGEVQAEFQAVTTLWETVDVYLFSVIFADDNFDMEFAGIIMSNGNLIRLEKLLDGGFSAITGALPQN